MAVYALYVPTARRPVGGIRMEVFASRELASRVLKQRNARGRSLVYRVGVAPGRVMQDFPEADATGYMRVFLRYARDPMPALRDTPDEEWVVEEGGRMGVVRRLPWVPARERIAVEGGRLRVVPGLPPRAPAVGRRRAWEVTCARRDCGAVFSAPARSVQEFQRMHMEQGWRRRGSVTGVVYYCAAHAS